MADELTPLARRLQGPRPGLQTVVRGGADLHGRVRHCLRNRHHPRRNLQLEVTISEASPTAGTVMQRGLCHRSCKAWYSGASGNERRPSSDTATTYDRSRIHRSSVDIGSGSDLAEESVAGMTDRPRWLRSRSHLSSRAHPLLPAPWARPRAECQGRTSITPHIRRSGAARLSASESPRRHPSLRWRRGLP